MKDIHRSESITQLSLGFRHGTDCAIVFLIALLLFSLISSFKLNTEEILEYWLANFSSIFLMLLFHILIKKTLTKY
jgi:hypothetical protein